MSIGGAVVAISAPTRVTRVRFLGSALFGVKVLKLLFLKSLKERF